MSETLPQVPNLRQPDSTPEIILEHIAVIRSGSETALAFVKEGYFPELVSFASMPAFWHRSSIGDVSDARRES